MEGNIVNILSGCCTGNREGISLIPCNVGIGINLVLLVLAVVIVLGRFVIMPF